MSGGDTILPLRVEGVSYQVGDTTLIEHLTFELRAGSRTVILGPNGAGKSLTLRLCHGLIAPTAGRISWAVPMASARRRQAMTFAEPLLLRRSLAANVAYGLAVNGVPRGARGERVAAALERTGLGALAERPARVLSSGERQRLSLARAWALAPEVLFLDEPTTNLDPAAAAKVEAVITAIHRSGTKVVMTTHDLAQARRLADEIIFLHRGRLLDHAPAEAFFTAPRSREAKAFIAGELVW